MPHTRCICDGGNVVPYRVLLDAVGHSIVLVACTALVEMIGRTPLYCSLCVIVRVVST